jgi:2-polyprenyl-3-methyl-5-hydroxy-6-metoxy-1,4-benzoquinol methylase
MNVQTARQMIKQALRLVVPAKVRAFIPQQLRARLVPYQPEVCSAEQWDEEYGSGRWDYLGDVSELARFSIVVGYCSILRPNGSILEVGCGPGILMRRLRTVGYASYFGVDLSKEAIEQAKVHQNENTRFQVANAETFQLSECYDVIVFNEMMFYLTDPRGVFLRYAKHLRPGGMVIISMYRADNSLRMWRLLEGAAPVRDAVTVANSTRGVTWDIKLYGEPGGSAAFD